jgi:hypothetical protein
MQIDLDWNNLYIMITKETGMTWNEIKKLDIKEFFLTIQNLQQNIEKLKHKENGNSNA